ncbi:MAG: tetratricopeptide repeat protein, partial [Chloroflexales bacterium]|nr:tetratricopeptide repeat protein [Chloroflexales bacterium]
MAALTTLLAAPDCRLLTLVGLGGVGKTRLAIEVATNRRDSFADGVCFVALAGLSATAQLVSAVSSALGLSLDRGPRPARRQLIDYLRRRRLLLILDNYDHLIEDVDLISQIVAAAPGVTLLVTARERLQLHCEYLLMLEGLATPQRGAGPDTATYDSVRLFLYVAEHVRPGFAPTDEDTRNIGAICCLVEGLPLAIEMAAAWVALLSPADILAELRHGIDLLTTDFRDVPERQRSVRAVCVAACRRLSAVEREVFVGLSVFRGGFTLDAARAVAAADHAVLSSLVGHALLRYDLIGDRFSFHELPRQYAVERLAADPAREAATRDRHAAHYLGSLARHALALQGEHQLEALAAISAEDENLHVAWDWAVTTGMAQLLDLAADALGHYYEWQGYLSEGEHAFRAAAQVASGWDVGSGHLRLQARLLAWHASFHTHEGPSEEALSHLSQSLDLLGRVIAAGEDGSAEQAFALWRLARLRTIHGDGDTVALYAQSLTLYRSLGREWELSLVLGDLGELLRIDGRFDEAEQVLREAQAICERAGDRRGLAQTMQLLSQICFEVDRLEEAERLARRSYELAQPLGNRPGLAAALGRIGVVLMHLSRCVEAVGYLERSLAHYEALGDGSGVALAHSRLALGLMHLGEFAAGHHQAQLAVANDGQSSELIRAETLLALALCEEAVGSLAAADTTLQEGIALCRAHGLSVMLGTFLAGRCAVAWQLGDPGRAKADAVAALRLALRHHTRLPLAMLLSSCVVPLIAEGQPERAAEIYALDADAPLWRDSQFV